MNFTRTQMAPSQAFANLDPETVLACIDSLGLETDGRLLALNSFENRVYQVGIENQAPIIAKFYRTPRWSDEAILDEHEFCFELQEADLQIVAPLIFQQESLFHRDELRFALYPRMGGRAPAFDQLDVAERLGRTIARLHNIGARGRFQFRASIDPKTMIQSAMQAALQSQLIPRNLHPRYRVICETLTEQIQSTFDLFDAPMIRLHGDCHPGNVLWRDDGPWFVDFDDALNGPAIADLWMLMSGTKSQQVALLDGYREFRDIEPRQLQLIEPLRILRQIRHASWIAARWHDPAFPLAFAYVGEAAYWERHLGDLLEASSDLAGQNR